MAASWLSGLLRLWKLGLLAGLLIIAAIFWWGGSAEKVQTTPVVQAFPSQTISVLNATGYVVAQRKASLSSKATGRLEWLGVAEGSVIKAGELVARLESRDVRAQLEQASAQVGVAQAELAETEQNFRRSEQLLAQKFISSSSHDAAIARWNKARAGLAAAQAAEKVAQANLAQTEIRAPFDAVVLTKNANVGDNITPFSSAADSKGAVVTIADMSTLEVETDVSESNIGRLKIGQPAEIGLDALPGERFAGSIARMVPTIDRSKATRLVKIRFDAIDLRVLPDMSAKVVFLERPLSEAERKPIVAVSRQAVVEEAGRLWVYLVEGERLKKIQLTIPTAASATTSATTSSHSSASDLVPVENLKPGQRVVIRPGRLQDGQRVKIVAQ
ncbi:MAG: efflux RND transporter periplasmic adaptor subunit [Burkholderiaceae bacterium]|nr:efflux RND transporter periplasmic adaptor subunit [Burkholderiaceae bacterium]